MLKKNCEKAMLGTAKKMKKAKMMKMKTASSKKIQSGQGPYKGKKNPKY